MSKRTKPPAPGRGSRVVELRSRTLQARKRRAAAKKQARQAKLQARQARRLFKDAKKVAKRAKAELASLSRKLRKLLGGRSVPAKPARKKTRRKQSSRAA